MTMFSPIHKNLLQKKKKAPHFTLRIGPIERGGLVLPYAPNPLHPPPPPPKKRRSKRTIFIQNTIFSSSIKAKIKNSNHSILCCSNAPIVSGKTFSNIWYKIFSAIPLCTHPLHSLILPTPTLPYHLPHYHPLSPVPPHHHCSHHHHAYVNY